VTYFPVFPTSGIKEKDPGADQNWYALNTLLNQFRIGDGSGYLTPANTGTSNNGAITIAASGPTLVLDFAAASRYDITLDQDCTISWLSAPPGDWHQRLILRGAFTPSFGPEVTFFGAAPSGPIQTALLQIDVNTDDESASIIANALTSQIGAPGAPGIVTASPTGATTATVNWTRPPNDGGDSTLLYTVIVRLNSTGAIVGSAHTGISALTFALTGLSAALHDIEVFATNATGFSGPSSFAQVTPSGTATVPGLVRSLVAIPGDGTMSCTFADPLSDGNSALTKFRGVCTQAGAGATTPNLLHAASTQTRVAVAAGTERQWTGRGTATAALTVVAPAFAAAPALGSGLIAFITHSGNGQVIDSAPPGFVRRAVGMDTTTNLLGSGADVMVEIWEKPASAVDGTETGTFTFTYTGSTATWSAQIVEVVGLGAWRGGSGTLQSGVYAHQAAALPSGSRPTFHSTGASQPVTDANTYSAAIFLGATTDSVTVDSGYTEHGAASKKDHIATKLISGAGGTTATTFAHTLVTGYNAATSVATWEVLPGGFKMTPTFTAATAGSKQIATVHYDGAGRTVTGPTGWLRLSSYESDTGVHVEVWRGNAIGGETSIDFIVSGADTDTTVTYQEFSGVGSSDPSVFLNPPATAAGTSLDFGTTASIADESLVYVAMTISATRTVTGWGTYSLTEDFAVGLAHVGHRIMSGAGTASAILDWTAGGAADAIGVVLVWAPAPTGHTQTVDTADATEHTIVFTDTPWVNGLVHSIAVHAINAQGDGPDTTINATPTAAVIPPGGGIPSIRAAMGTSKATKAFLTGGSDYWKANAAPTGVANNFGWNFNVIVDTASAQAVTEFGHPGDPICEFRIGQYSGGQYTLAQINSGAADATIDNTATNMQLLTIAQGGVPQMYRPLWEFLGDWQAWLCDPANISPFVTAIRRIIARVKAICPTAQAVLCDAWRCGGGFATSLRDTHSTVTWDAIMAQLGGIAFGGLIHYNSFNTYSNGAPKTETNTGLDPEGNPFNTNGNNWAQNELMVIEAGCVRWGTQLAFSEWGIGGLGPTIPASKPPHNYGAAEFATIFLDVWAGLPATGPGSLHHVLLFDGSPSGSPLALPDGRGVIKVPDPVSNPDGIIVASTIKTYLA
jgi:hypothetical protein